MFWSSIDPLWGDPPSFAMPSKDGFVIMLSYEEGKAPRPNGPMKVRADFSVQRTPRPAQFDGGLTSVTLIAHSV